MSMEMTDEYRLKENMYRKCLFIVLKLAVSLHLIKHSKIFILNFFLQLELCLSMFMQKENTCVLLRYSRYKVHICSLDCI